MRSRLLGACLEQRVIWFAGKRRCAFSRGSGSAGHPVDATHCVLILSPSPASLAPAKLNSRSQLRLEAGGYDCEANGIYFG